MKVNYSRLSSGKESNRHYEGSYRTKEARRKERRSDDRKICVREAVYAR